MNSLFDQPEPSTPAESPTAAAAGKNAAARRRPFRTYNGGKAGAGVYQQIINLMPPHDTYIELFLGGGAVLINKRPAAFSVGVEIDPETASRWKRCAIENFHLHRCDALDYLDKFTEETIELRKHLENFRPKTLIYADPPYLLETRSYKRPLYKCEFNTRQLHLALLSRLRNVPADVMISGYDSELYNEILHDWRKVQFSGISRGGRRTETVWMNFAEPAELHDYRYLGNDKRERENLKRQKQRWIDRIDRMPPQKRYAMLSAIEEYKRSTAGETTGEK